MRAKDLFKDAKDFFKYAIEDNNYNGIPLTGIDFAEKGKNSNDKLKKGVQNFVTDLYNNIASKKLTDLNITQITFNEEFEANKDNEIFSITGNSFDNIKIFTNNIVGSISYETNLFNINCRFGNSFLQYMIANASGFLEMENYGTLDKEIGLGEWILIYYWKLQLKKAFSLGLYKTYQRKTDNLSAIRGEIDINSLIKKGYFDGKTVCNYKEHSYNNKLNCVIGMALNKVFKSKYLNIVSDIFNIKNAFDSITDHKISFRPIAIQKVINPYFKIYNNVYDLSLKILNDEFANVGENNSNISAFLFDISLLFEHHIRIVLKQIFTLFPKNKEEFKIPNGIYENNIYPDIIIDHGENKISIYEVKYKRFDFKDGIKREDRFQLISYVAAHLTKYKVIGCGVIYPLNMVEDESEVIKVKKQTLLVCGQKIPFHVKFYQIDKDMERQKKLDMNFITYFQNV